MHSVSIVRFLVICGAAIGLRAETTVASGWEFEKLLARLEAFETRLNAQMAQYAETFQEKLTNKLEDQLQNITNSIAKTDGHLKQLIISHEANLAILQSNITQLSDQIKSVPEANTTKLEEHQQNAQSAACNLEAVSASIASVDKRLKEAEENNTGTFATLQTYIAQLSHQVAIATDHLSQAGLNQSKHLEQRLEELTAAAGVYTEKYDVSDMAFRVYRDGLQHHGYGGNWTVFQRRMDGSVDFNRSWADYKYGFGDLRGEHWLGLQKLLRILSSERHELLIELEDFGGNIVYANYDDFQLESEGKWYKIKSLGSYSGTAGDSMENYVGRTFVTYGSRDVHKCAIQFQGGGWFDKCYSMHLNGPYKTKGEQTTQEGIHWGAYRGFYYSLKATKMMVRPYKSNA